MVGPPSRAVPIVFGSASTDTEEGRSFYQDRLQLFSGCVFLISGGFYIVDAAMRLLGSRAIAPTPIFLGTHLDFHLAGTAIAGGLWLLFRQRRFAFPALRRLDVVATILLSTCFALMAAALALDHTSDVVEIDPQHAIMIGLLACTYVVLARGVALPSAPSRTAWISALAMVPIVAVNAYVLAQDGAGGAMLAIASIDVGTWGVAAVTMAAISSRIIFGLRAEATKVRRLGQYTLEQKIGEGGMGVVYRGYHAMLRRPTAIKLLRPDKVGEASIRRFEREVQLTARLTHPNTVAVFDYGRTPDGLFYYAMEYLDGLNLDQLVRADGPQSPGRVIYLLLQACGALAEAHGVGLIHGDIKPANILLVDRGGVPDVVKVVDFGLVKHVDPGGMEATMTVTAGNVLQGTPLYLSPEAIKNELNLDARSDLYALGAVGYFLLTGGPVFEANSVVEIFAHHLHTTPVPPSQRAPQPIPASLDAAILQCLAKDPGERPKDAQPLQRILACCPCQVPWSSEDAAAWWVGYRARQQSQPRVLPEGAELPTLAVDIGDRVGR